MSARHAHRSRKRRRSKQQPPGASPGTLSVDPEAPRSAVHLFVYGPDELREQRGASVTECVAARAPGRVVWLDVTGLGNAATLGAMAEAFGLHPLAMEDVLHLEERPKAEPYGDQLFTVVRTLNPDTDTNEQLSMFLRDGLLITFQEREGDCFEPVRRRLRRGGRIRRAGADYLQYALLDAALDGLRPLLDSMQTELDTIEEALLAGEVEDPTPHLHRLRHRLAELRRDVTPMREVLLALARDEAELFAPETKIFLRDCQDHVAMLLDGIESGRDLVNSLVDMGVSLMSRKLNETMRVLTIIATLFIPLSFLAGVFGMNFDTESSPWNMPELRQPWGYPAALGLMAAVAMGMLLWFRRRGWIGAHRPRRDGDRFLTMSDPPSGPPP